MSSIGGVLAVTVSCSQMFSGVLWVRTTGEFVTVAFCMSVKVG